MYELFSFVGIILYVLSEVLEMDLPYAEPYRIKVVESIRRSTRSEREKWLKECNYNLFGLKSSHVYIDLLSDSGVGAMSDKQWGAMMTGDESYAGSKSFHKMSETVKWIFGLEYVLPTHQGRGAENVLHSTIVKEGDIIPGNTHFDTTKGHIELRQATAVDCSIDEAFDINVYHPFKGNLNVDKLEKIMKSNPPNKIPMIVISVTCNTSGGQPVSIRNLEQVSSLAKTYGIRICIDAARFAENAYFIKKREDGYQDCSIRDIVLKMFSYADIVTMSAKKDALVNIGGFVAFREMDLYKKASTYNILFEGFLTYGGMAGRDMEALAEGLKENTVFETLDSRIQQVKFLADKLSECDIPYQTPVGGHAVYVDAGKLLRHIPKEEFPAQTLTCELYLEAGVRCVEIGTLLADRDPITRKNRYSNIEFMRMAIPRRTYTKSHLEYIAAAMRNVKFRCENLKRGLTILYEPEIMRHFTAKLDRAGQEPKDIKISY